MGGGAAPLACGKRRLLREMGEVRALLVPLSEAGLHGIAQSGSFILGTSCSSAHHRLKPTPPTCALGGSLCTVSSSLCTPCLSRYTIFPKFIIVTGGLRFQDFLFP